MFDITVLESGLELLSPLWYHNISDSSYSLYMLEIVRHERTLLRVSKLWEYL